MIELPPPINRDPPRELTPAEAAAEQWEREAGQGPDGYLKREAPPTPEQIARRNAEVDANQPEKLN